VIILEETFQDKGVCPAVEPLDRFFTNKVSMSNAARFRSRDARLLNRMPSE
jgi:hypothetical protein